MSPPLLHVDDIRVDLQRPGSHPVRVLDGISFRVFPGETVALAGHAGSGKTTLTRVVFQAIKALKGRIVVNGVDLLHRHGRELQAARQRIQWLPGAARGTFNPSWSLRRSLDEPLTVEPNPAVKDRARRLDSLVEYLGIDPRVLDVLPHELSDDSLAVLALARAAMPAPQLIVADEPCAELGELGTSRLLGLLRGLIRERYVACIFLSRDLAACVRVADRVGVLYAGRIIEIGPAGGIWEFPLHPYTRSLVTGYDLIEGLAGPPRPHVHLKGEIPAFGRLPSGCVLHPRCPIADTTLCPQEPPPLRRVAFAQRVACHFAEPPEDVEEIEHDRTDPEITDPNRH